MCNKIKGPLGAERDLEIVDSTKRNAKAGYVTPIIRNTGSQTHILQFGRVFAKLQDFAGLYNIPLFLLLLALPAPSFLNPLYFRLIYVILFSQGEGWYGLENTPAV